MPAATTLPFILLVEAAGPAAVDADIGSDVFDACEMVRMHLSRAAAERGYAVTSTVAGLGGIDAANNRLDARCEAGRSTMILTAADGVSVSVEFDAANGGGSLGITGDFPGVGALDRTVVLTGFAGGTTTGFITTAAEVGAEVAVVEHDLAAETSVSSGDLASTSIALAPMFDSSKIWRDGHVFAFALSGSWDMFQGEMSGAAEAALAVLCGAALPDVTRMSQADKTTFKTCLGAAGSCWRGAPAQIRVWQRYRMLGRRDGVFRFGGVLVRR